MLILFDTYTLHRDVEYWWIYADALIATITLVILKAVVEISYGHKPNVKLNMDWQQALILVIFALLTVNMLNDEFKHKKNEKLLKSVQ